MAEKNNGDLTLFSNFDCIFAYCFQLFKNKDADYGPTWLLYRYQSLNDEIWRKAKRIRTLEENHDRACIPEGRDAEYVGIINYCIMFCIKLQGIPGVPLNNGVLDDFAVLDAVDHAAIYQAYASNVEAIKDLLKRKNTDYGDAWKSMSICSMTDQVIIRTYRIRTILENRGKCIASEGIMAQLYDIINYCVFALIKMNPDLIRFHPSAE